MDRIERPKAARSEFANQSEIPRTDPAESDTPTGREDHLGLAEAGATAASDIKQPIGAQPRSEVTGFHDVGSGANETADGLTELDETLRGIALGALAAASAPRYGYAYGPGYGYYGAGYYDCPRRVVGYTYYGRPIVRRVCY